MSRAGPSSTARLVLRPIRDDRLRSFALTLAVFWSLQLAVCLIPAGAETQDHHEHATGAHASRSHDHGEQPADGGHHGSSGCEEHCASLSRTLTASAGSLPIPSLALAPPIAVPTAAEHSVARAAALDRLQRERPPPDLLARYSTLRI